MLRIVLHTVILKGEKGNHMSRGNTNKRVDKKIFSRTAASTKKININPKVMRGGTRL